MQISSLTNFFQANAGLATELVVWIEVALSLATKRTNDENGAL
jgi:hypothetical protein